MGKNLTELFKKIIIGSSKSWVLFENGTCVILVNPKDDLKKLATTILSEYGPVHVGTSSGDFNVITLEGEEGWIVGCHHPDILTYVSPGEVSKNPEELTIGMLGRSKRNLDSEDLSIVHVEDKRFQNNE